ncbi:MAG: hypothetical protein OCC45_12140 [Desulfotalea sp.]
MADNEVSIVDEYNAQKIPYKEFEVKEILAENDNVFVTSGKKIFEFSCVEEQDEILGKILGRTGNLRAPTIKIDKTLFVGFNVDIYDRIIEFTKGA